MSRQNVILRPAVWLALLAVTVTLAIGIRTTQLAQKPMSGIDIESLMIAGDLSRSLDAGGLETRREPHVRMPAYPLFLSVLATADPALRRGLACRPAATASCAKANFTSLYMLQAFVAAATLALAFLLARMLSRSVLVAGITTLGVLLASRPGDLAGFVTPIVVSHFLVVLFAVLSVAAWQYRSPVVAALAGFAGGSAATIEPTMIVLPLAAAFVVAAAANAGLSLAARLVSATAMLVAAAGAVAVLYGLAISLGYDADGIAHHVGQRLAERVAFNQLGAGGAVAGALIHIPLLGDLLQQSVMSADVARKFAMYQSGSLVFQGATQLHPAAINAAGSPGSAVATLIEQNVMATPGSYLAALPAVLSRGMWGGAGLIGLIGIFHVWRAGRYLQVEAQLVPFLLVLVPAIALLLANILVTPNYPHLSPMLPFVFAFAICHVAGGP